LPTIERKPNFEYIYVFSFSLIKYQLLYQGNFLGLCC